MVSLVRAFIRSCHHPRLFSVAPSSPAPALSRTFRHWHLPSLATVFIRTCTHSHLPSVALAFTGTCPQLQLPSFAFAFIRTYAQRTCLHSHHPSLNSTQTTKSQAIKRPLSAVPSSFALKRGILWVFPLPRAAKRSLSVRLSEWREEERSMISVRPSVLDPILPGALPPNI
jgi:hypothetical protein